MPQPMILDSMVLPSIISATVFVLFIVFSYVLYHAIRLLIVLSELVLEAGTRVWTWFWNIVNEHQW